MIGFHHETIHTTMCTGNMSHYCPPPLMGSIMSHYQTALILHFVWHHCPHIDPPPHMNAFTTMSFLEAAAMQHVHKDYFFGFKAWSIMKNVCDDQRGSWRSSASDRGRKLFQQNKQFDDITLGFRWWMFTDSSIKLITTTKSRLLWICKLSETSVQVNSTIIYFVFIVLAKPNWYHLC